MCVLRYLQKTEVCHGLEPDVRIKMTIPTTDSGSSIRGIFRAAASSDKCNQNTKCLPM